MTNSGEKRNNLTLNELQKIDIKNVSTSVTKEDAMLICRKYLLESGLSTSGDILSLWFRKLLRAYTKSSWSTSADWQLLLSFLDELQEPFISRLKSEQASSLTEYAAFLNDTLDFGEWAKPFLMNADESVVTVLSSFLLTIVLNFAKFYDECNDDSCKLEDHMSSTIALHQTILRIVNEFISSADLQDISPKQLTFLIPQLCEAGELLKPLSLRVVIENWKTVTKVCKHFLNGRRYDESPTWLQQPLKSLLTEVADNINTVYLEDTLTEPIEQVQKFLRVTNFYTQLLHELFTIGFQHVDDHTLETYFNTLISLHCKPTYTISNDILNLLERYLHMEFLKLLQTVLQRKCLHKLLLDFVGHQRTNMYCIDVVLDFLNAAIKTETGLTLDTCSLFIDLFELIFKDSHYLSTTTDYDQLIEMYAAIICSDTSGNILNYLQNDIFKQHASLSLASEHVLLTVSHVSADYVDDAELIRSFWHWLKVNNAFALFSTNPVQLLALQMHRNSFRLCCARSTILKDDLCGGVGVQFDLSQYRLLQCVGCEHVSNFNDKFALSLSNASKDGFTVRKYYEMIACMKLKAANNVSMSDQLPFFEMLIILSQRIQRQSNMKASCQIFLDSFYALLECVATNAKLHVFEKLFMDGILNGYTSWHMQKYLFACADVDVRYHSRVQQLISAIGDNAILLNELCRINKCPAALMKNNCYATRESDVGQQPEKRLRLMQNEKHPAKEIVDNIVAQLEELKSYTLDIDDKFTLRSVALNLLKMAGNTD